MQSRIDNAGRFLEKMGGFIIAGIGLVVGAALTYYSAFYTEICLLDEDVGHTAVDSGWRNLLAFVLFLGLSWIVRFWVRSKQEQAEKLEKVFLIAALLIGFTAGTVWTVMAHIKPIADSGNVCTVAEYMLRGEFPMQLPTYMGYNPQQYGMVFVLQCMFACFGSGNYFVWQIMNVLLFPLMIYAGYRIVKLMTRDTGIALYYLILILSFLPFYYYLPYVYGDFPSAACGMVVMWQIMEFCRNRKNHSAVIAVLFALFGYVIRKNTIIVIIASCLVLIVCALRNAQDRIRMLAAALIMVLAAWGGNQAIYLYYEHISGQEISPGIPASCYIMMGLEDKPDKGPGWFNGDNYMALVRVDYDCEAADEYGKEQIRLRLKEFWNDKRYAVDFFRRKITSQWNMPDCFALHETEHFTVDESELPAVVRETYFGDLRNRLENYMNRYQFILYAGFAIAMGIMLFRPKKEMEYYLTAAAIIGGMCFSIIWEAMSRYVLAYEGYMIPLAAIGIWQFLGWVENRLR